MAGGDDVDVAGIQRTRLEQRLADDRVDLLHVGPARDLGHDATEPGVEVDLARDHRRQHVPAVGDDGGGGLVARGLDPQDLRHQRLGSSTTVSPRTCRSIPSSSSAYASLRISCAHITSASSFVSA